MASSYSENRQSLAGPWTPHTIFAFLSYPHRPPCDASEYASRALGWGCHTSCLSPLLENLAARAPHGSPEWNLCSDLTLSVQPPLLPSTESTATSEPASLLYFSPQTRHCASYFCLSPPLTGQLSRRTEASFLTCLVHCCIPSFENSKHLISFV